MSITPASEAPTGIPEGYAAIPIHETELGAAVRVCVLARPTPDPATGHLILLRDLPDAMVYLGCLTDSAGRLREWVELWVQNLDGLDSSLPALRESFSNSGMDDRWGRIATSFQRLRPQQCIVTGWETEHPLPAFLDLSRRLPIHPETAGQRWRLCEDDLALTSAGLPPFGTSLFRYLIRPSSSSENEFLPVVAGSPANRHTRPLAEAVGDTRAHIPFNPQAGLLRVQGFAPLGYEEFVDLLSGKTWKGFEQGKKVIQFGGIYGELDDWNKIQQSGRFLFFGNRGFSGRFTETFHLKLQAFTEALGLARSFVDQHQLPFLNLAADSFRVDLADLGDRLPSFWTGRTTLVKPSHAYALPVDSSDFRYFIRARTEGTSTYHPEGLNHSLQGSGVVRIRTVLPPDQGRTLLEGTLVMQEQMTVSPHDLLWIRLPLQGRRLDLYGHLYTTDGLTQSEARFRTLPQKLPSELVAALRAAEGVTFPRSPFEVVPLLSTPCDLYALGVLAVRTFLVNPQNSLGVALDDLLSLGREAAGHYSPELPLAQRITSILSRDERFARSLAPHRLVQEPMDPAQAFEFLPGELWSSLLSVVMRLFPGLGPDSYCKDYGDAPSLALESVFNAPLEELEKLLIRSRSLLLIDWNSNREIHSAIRDILDRQV